MVSLARETNSVIFDRVTGGRELSLSCDLKGEKETQVKSKGEKAPGRGQHLQVASCCTELGKGKVHMSEGLGGERSSDCLQGSLRAMVPSLHFIFWKQWEFGKSFKTT